MNYKALIVDDETEAREVLSLLLSDFDEIKIVGEAKNGEEALEKTLLLKPDIIFLDIEMPVKSGFDFIQEVNKYELDFSIIFVTAFNKYAIEAFKYAAFDYLLKPVERIELAKTIQRYKSNRKDQILSEKTKLLFEKINYKQIKLKTINGFVLINPDDIAYCIADGNYANVFTKNGDKVFVSCYLGDVLNKLNKDNFFRISRSVFINLSLLHRVNKKNRKCQIEVQGKKIHFSLTSRAISELDNLFSSPHNK